MKAMILVTSDNYDLGFFTPKAYKELTLQMPTGDFHSHKHTKIMVESYPDDIITIDDLHEADEIEFMDAEYNSIYKR